MRNCLKLTGPTNDRCREASRGNHDALAYRSGIPPLTEAGAGACWIRLAAVLSLMRALAVLLKWILFHGRVTVCVVVSADTGLQLSVGAGFFTLVLSDSVARIIERAGRVPMPLAARREHVIGHVLAVVFHGGANLRK